MIDSFKKFLADTKELHPDFRKKLNDSCKTYYELFRISSSPERYDSEKIDKQIAFVKASGINAKEWYLGKLEELKKQY